MLRGVLCHAKDNLCCLLFVEVCPSVVCYDGTGGFYMQFNMFQGADIGFGLE